MSSKKILVFLLTFYIGIIAAGLVRNYKKLKNGEVLEANVYGKILSYFFKEKVKENNLKNQNNRAVKRTKSNRKKKNKKK